VEKRAAQFKNGDTLTRPKIMKTFCVCPVLQVADLSKALVYYCDVLGFEQDFVYGEPPFYASVKQGEAKVHLASASASAARRGFGSAYFFCDNVDAYYASIVSKGAAVTSALADHPYGMRDFQIKDLDGNLIGFGHPLEEEEAGKA
jgi:uncharacterized glyoxalase superfamily protein PhnB